MPEKFSSYLERKQAEFGPKFDPSDLAQKFVPYYSNGQRIIVKTRWGEILRGYVGVTTGWKPSFILIKTTRSLGSSDLLTVTDEIVGTVNRYRR